jgi:hypothetical protein
MKYSVLIFCLIMINCLQWSIAQPPFGSEQMDREAEAMIEATAVRYIDSVAGFSTLYYGRLQEPYWYTATNHPYLKDVRYTKGIVRYGGTYYPDILLRWDMNRDELLVFAPGNHSVVLSPDKTEEAVIHGYSVIYLQDSLTNSPPPGYYLLLHTGRYTVLAKPAAVNQQRTYQQRIENVYMITTKYYIKKDGAYYPVRNKTALLNVLSDYQKELNHLIRVNRYSFRRDAEKMLVETVKEFERHLP